jgi:hypothetical protein
MGVVAYLLAQALVSPLAALIIGAAVGWTLWLVLPRASRAG